MRLTTAVTTRPFTEYFHLSTHHIRRLDYGEGGDRDLNNAQPGAASFTADVASLGLSTCRGGFKDEHIYT
jgi:hypothetical protein